LSFGLESPIHAPKILVFGEFYLKIQGHPQKALPCAERRVWALIDPDLTHSATCGLAKKTKKWKKEKNTMANWLFAQTTHVAVSKSKFACRVASDV